MGKSCIFVDVQVTDVMRAGETRRLCDTMLVIEVFGDIITWLVGFSLSPIFSPHTPEYSRIVRMRVSHVRVFTAVGALRRLRWRKARVPLAFLVVALTCGDQDECLWRDTPRHFAVCFHVPRRTPSLDISFWWFVAVGISVDGNSSSTAVPILEGHQGPPGVRLHLPAIISLYRRDSHPRIAGYEMRWRTGASNLSIQGTITAPAQSLEERLMSLV